MIRRFAPYLSALVCSAALAGTITVGAPVELTGRLALRGNEPFVYAVLYEPTGVWELQGIAIENARQLQGNTVDVKGIVERTGSSGVQLPALLVRKMEVRTVEP
ncbi:hypothetical protein [Paraburkholderia sp. RL17-337-BIB-A]|uniref:hypothetical protein n=1 Tax=Paraburkholderia sp. RL17-337-BIB-A TaxID=3031636 RepID=UPI0038BD364E